MAETSWQNSSFSLAESCFMRTIYMLTDMIMMQWQTKCQTCLNVNEMDSVISSEAKEAYRINHCFNCNEKCFIFLLTGKVCLKQYVGQTVDKVWFRWNKYKSNNRKHQRFKSYMQVYLSQDFNAEGHIRFLQDVSSTFIDKTDPSELLKR